MKRILLILPLLFNMAYVLPQSKTSDESDISFFVEHGKILNNGQPGFFAFVEGWTPLESLQLHLVDHDGETFIIVGEDNSVATSDEGSIWLEIPYLLHEWAPGACIFVLSGKDGVHLLDSELPEITPPSDSNPNWKLGFSQAFIENYEGSQ